MPVSEGAPSCHGDYVYSSFPLLLAAKWPFCNGASQLKGAFCWIYIVYQPIRQVPEVPIIDKFL